MSVSDDEDDGRKLEFGSYDVHVFAGRKGGAKASITLPNGHRTRATHLTAFQRKVLLEIVAQAKLYDGVERKR